MKNYFPIITDSLFCSFLSFLILKVIFSTFLGNSTSNVFSIVIALSLFIVYFALFNKKFSSKKAKKSEEKQSKQVLMNLLFLSEDKIFDLFYSAFSNLNKSPKKLGAKIFLPEDNEVVFLSFSIDGLKKSQIIKAFNSLNEGQNALILSYDCNSDTINFAKNFNNKIKIKSGFEVYSILKKANVFPLNAVVPFIKDSPKYNFKLLFNKKREKSYFFFGIIFLLYSFIVPIKIYYIIIGCTFLIASIACLLFAKNID